MLTAVLAGAAFAAGLTGAWSPCGFSMVETIGAARGRPALALSSATFALGALAGGVATFAGLAALGVVVPFAGAGLVFPAALLTLAAAVAEARGVRVVPQVRRQVPEPWRRLLPLPVAAAGYGVLLGLGFATFVLTLAFWVLAAATFALADLTLGLAVGLAFAGGRALPVVALAAFGDRPLRLAVTDVMAMRPGVLRGFRLANAVALALCAAALLAGGASAATTVARGAADPGVAGDALVWKEAGRGMLLLAGPREPAGAHHLGALAAPLPGTDPALGDDVLAWREGSLVRVVRVADFTPVAELSVPGVDAFAVSARWLAYRVRRNGRDRIAARPLAGGPERVLAVAGAFAALGRPSLSGDVVAFHHATPRESRIVAVSLPVGRPRIVRRARLAQLSHASVHGASLLHVRTTALGQALVLGPLGRPARDRVLRREGPVAPRDAGHEQGHSTVTRTPRVRQARDRFWTTALSPRAAYLTLVPIRGPSSATRIVRIRR